jgi:hypothetical protein
MLVRQDLRLDVPAVIQVRPASRTAWAKPASSARKP